MLEKQVIRIIDEDLNFTRKEWLESMDREWLKCFVKKGIREIATISNLPNLNEAEDVRELAKRILMKKMKKRPLRRYR